MFIAADNLHALNPLVMAALGARDPQPLQELARKSVAAGADLVDLNPGYLSRRQEDRMAFLVEAVQEVTDRRLILDSTRAGVLRQGLKVCRQRPILNALTLEADKIQEILPLAAEHETDLVVLLLDERSMPPAAMEDKITLAGRLAALAMEGGVPLERLIFDPVLPNLSWPDAWRLVQEVVQTVRWLASGEVFGQPVRTMAGLSNLRSGRRHMYPAALDATVLGVLAGAGLEVALMDVLQPEVQEAAQLIQRIMG